MGVRAPGRLPRGFSLPDNTFSYRGPRERGALKRPTPPPDFPGTDLEWIVFVWLTKHNVEFSFQSSLFGGRIETGGIVADFILTNTAPPIALRVMGFYWHYNNPSYVARDTEQKIRLLDQGYEVVDLQEDDLIHRVDYVMELAIIGVEIPRVP